MTRFSCADFTPQVTKQWSRSSIAPRCERYLRGQPAEAEWRTVGGRCVVGICHPPKQPLQTHGLADSQSRRIARRERGAGNAVARLLESRRRLRDADRIRLATFPCRVGERLTPHPELRSRFHAKCTSGAARADGCCVEKPRSDCPRSVTTESNSSDASFARPMRGAHRTLIQPGGTASSKDDPRKDLGT